MKFIHLSNVRLGLDEETQASLPVSMRNIKEHNLLQILSDARSVNVDVIFITGRLFVHTPDLMDLMKADELFRFSDDIPIVCLLSGEDEAENQAVLSYSWSCDITFLGQDTFVPLCLYRPKADIYGCIKLKDLPELLQRLEKPSPRRARMLLLNELPQGIDFQRYECFDYVALGSEQLGSRKIVNMIYAPGKLVAESFTEETRHGYFFVDIDTSTKNGNCGFVASSAPEFLTIKVHAAKGVTIEELQDTAKSAIALYGDGNLFRILVDGENREEVLEKKSAFLSINRVVEIGTEE